MCKTTIGFGSPNKAGSAKSHGSPLGPDEVTLTKQNLGIPLEPTFFVPEEAATFMCNQEAGKSITTDWESRWSAFAAAYPAEAAELGSLIEGKLPSGWTSSLPSFTEAFATRKNGFDVRVINGLLQVIGTLSVRTGKGPRTELQGFALPNRELPVVAHDVECGPQVSVGKWAGGGNNGHGITGL